MELIICCLLVMISSSGFGAATECGKIMNTSNYSGTIISPFNTSNKSCLWNIELAQKFTASQIRFHDLALRNCTNCSCDYIEVWNSRTKDNKHWLGKFCGDLKDKYIDTAEGSNNLLVEFRSTTWSGMKSNHTFLSYRGVESPNDCGKISNTSMGYGTITSPTNTAYKRCQWRIQVSSRMTDVHLKFHDLTLRNCANCSCDYIEVWGSRTKDPKHWIGKFCGDLKHKHVYSKGNTVLVEFGSTSWSGMKSNHIFLSYQGSQIIICYFPTYVPYENATSRPGTFVAVGIVVSVLLLIGALACGVFVSKHIKSKRRRRVCRRTPLPLEQPEVEGYLPTLPKLPNYFDTDNNSVLPPYLGFTGEENKGVETSEPPPPYDEPPPYSITEAAEIAGLESTVERIASERPMHDGQTDPQMLSLHL